MSRCASWWSKRSAKGGCRRGSSARRGYGDVMGETAISWVARHRVKPTSDFCPVLETELPADERCLSISCERCWVQGFTVNPWVGCVERNDACKNCYARTTAENRMGLDVWGKNKPRAIRIDKAIRELRRIEDRCFRQGQRVGVFSGSMCDIFEERSDLDNAREWYLAAAAAAEAVDVMLLTKRPENIAGMVPSGWLNDWPRNVWIGATIASPGDERMAPLLADLKEAGATTFASVEPMLGTGPTLGEWLRVIDLCLIGGESGGGARPFDVDAARRLVEACDDYGSKVWFKQMGSRWAQQHSGGLRKGASHGQDPYRWPEWARRRELP